MKLSPRDASAFFRKPDTRRAGILIHGADAIPIMSITPVRSSPIWTAEISAAKAAQTMKYPSSTPHHPARVPSALTIRSS